MNANHRIVERIAERVKSDRALTKDSLCTKCESLKHVGARTHSGVEEDCELAGSLGLLNPGGFTDLFQSIESWDCTVQLASAWNAEIIDSRWEVDHPWCAMRFVQSEIR